MSYKVSHLTVVLERDVTTDEAEILARAICSMRNVASVGTNVTDGVAWMAQARAKQEVVRRVSDTLRDIVEGKP